MTVPPMLPPAALRFLQEARVGHLATAGASAEPSVVPVCFAIDPPHVFTVIDAKPKRVGAEQLRRVRNLRANPRAALVVDRWDEDWSRLGYVLLRGTVELIEQGPAHARGLELLRAKYDLYRAMKLERSILIGLRIETHHCWGDLSRPQFSATPLAAAL